MVYGQTCINIYKYFFQRTEQKYVPILSILASVEFSEYWLVLMLCCGMCLCYISVTGCTDELPTWLVSIIPQMSSLSSRYLCMYVKISESIHFICTFYFYGRHLWSSKNPNLSINPLLLRLNGMDEMIV